MLSTTDQRGPKALLQRFYTVQPPLMTRKGEIENRDKTKAKHPHQTLNTAQLTALKTVTAEIIEETRLVMDTSEDQTQRTAKSPLQTNMLKDTGTPPKRGKGTDCQRTIKERRTDNVKMRTTESISGAVCQRRAENVRNRD